MVVDANFYWLPEDLFSDEALGREFLSSMPKEGPFGRAEILPGGLKQIVIEKPKGYQNLNYVEGEYSWEKQRRDLDAAGVDRAVLKLPGCQEWLSLDLCRRFNDGMLHAAKVSGGRLIPVAAVPPDSGEKGIAELRRCHMLGMGAVQLCSHYGNSYLDDPRFQGILETAESCGMTVYVHHNSLPVDHSSLLEYNNLRRSYGRCMEQCIAVSREIFSGMFEKYPKLKMVHSMLGGGLFAIYHTMFPKKPKVSEAVSRFDEDRLDVERYFRENLFFEMSHAQPWGQAALEYAVKILGAGHVVFGTSYPVRREWLLDGPDCVRSLQLQEREKEQILAENALSLYTI